MAEYVTETKGFTEIKKNHMDMLKLKITPSFFVYGGNTRFYNTSNQIIENAKNSGISQIYRNTHKSSLWELVTICMNIHSIT